MTPYAKFNLIIPWTTPFHTVIYRHLHKNCAINYAAGDKYKKGVQFSVDFFNYYEEH